MEVLRLLVLLNECHQGLSKKHLDPLRQELLHTYGHQHLLTLSNLETAGFIRPASSSAKASFKEMRKALRLSVPESEEPQSQQQSAAGGGEPPSFKPNDVSFLYKGYAPLSIRLVETALSPLGWSPFAEVRRAGSWEGRGHGILDGLAGTAKPAQAGRSLGSVSRSFQGMQL